MSSNKKYSKLRGKIVEAGFSQRSLAKALGISKNTLNAKVNGRTPFNTDEIELICDKLGIRDGAEKAAIFLPEPSQKWDFATDRVQNAM